MDYMHATMQLYAEAIQLVLVLTMLLGTGFAAAGSIYCLRPKTRAGYASAAWFGAACVLASPSIAIWQLGDVRNLVWMLAPCIAAIFSPWIGIFVDWRISRRHKSIA